MALLHYQNLGVDKPEKLMSNAVYGLKIVYDFLTRTRTHLKEEAVVKRLAWSLGTPPNVDEDDKNNAGFWIELNEPEGSRNEPEATFPAFLDENVREVYECMPKDVQQKSFCFILERKIKVLDRQTEPPQLLLERRPVDNSQLLLRPNTYTINCQRKALQVLQSTPQREHLPLLQLFNDLKIAEWKSPSLSEINDADWMVLTVGGRPGTDEQRRFVNIALNTPDFAFLEGPPGSGKTTAICELILQLMKCEKRVLLCASTHVAVDNVLERLMDDSNLHRHLVIPVRIGDKNIVSHKARCWQLDLFVKTERDRILKGLRQVKTHSLSQKAMLDLLLQGDGGIERMVLEAANLVCGTTIGILQHPYIKKRSQARLGATPNFDVLIVDEASKTPFQEFLVPALWAKRWIIVGDPNQLSPYVDEDALAVNVEACLPDREIRDVCIDVFGAADRRRQHVTVAVDMTSKGKDAYIHQCKDRGVEVVDVDNAENRELWSAAVVLGSEDSLNQKVNELPLDITNLRCGNGDLPLLRRRTDAWLRLSKQNRREQPEWAKEVGWRLVRLYEQRLTKVNVGMNSKQRLEVAIQDLLPVQRIGIDRSKLKQNIVSVQRVALPSVLELLRNGFERNGNVLTDGLPKHVFEQRHIRLSTQHRMHPEIAEFSHVHIYDKEALRTPDYMERERRWSYSRYDYRNIWIHVPARNFGNNNNNKMEASKIIEELGHFDDWARKNHKHEKFPWEVAVLSLYRGQEREIRSHLRVWTGSSSGRRRFCRGPKERPHIQIELCTVDRFQGHEADLVIISFANRRATSFLESPNRLNVALTRARYQRVVVGDIHAMRKARPGVLKDFADSEKWDQVLGRAG